MRSAPLPLPKGQAGAAADIINTVWMLAATLGVAVLGVVFAARAGVSPVNAKRIVAGPHPAAFIGGALGELLGAFAGLARAP